MKETLLDSICCPMCSGELSLHDAVSQAGCIVSGSLRCDRCEATYPIIEAMPRLLREDRLEETKRQEMQGWPSIWKKLGMYENARLELSFDLPYIGDMWTEVAKVFDMALGELDLQGGEVVLDLAAGQGWAARHFAERGCQAIAVDIVADSSFGLGRAWAIMEHAGVYFEPLLADGDRLPFHAGTFDVVFMCGSLHHFLQLDKVLQQVYRVLRPGGRFIAVNEPAIEVYTKETAVQATLQETDEGITERRPNVWEYRRALRQAGFRRLRIDNTMTFHSNPRESRRWAIGTRNMLSHNARTRYKPLIWGVFGLIALLPHRWRQWFMLYTMGGNMLLRGSKPA